MAKGDDMKVFICDDEPQILKQISKRVQALLGECVIREFSDGAGLCNGLKGEECDVLLLDIDLPDISGLRVAEWLKDMEQKPMLIFVTSHDELVYDSFHFHPFGFIRKTCIDIELVKVLEDCVRELSGREQFFCFKSGSTNIRIKLPDICYFESDGNYLKVFTTGGKYRLRDTIAAVEEQLAGKGFIRLHRGFLVNQRAVKAWGSDEVQLFMEKKLPIGRSYGEAAKKQWMRYMLR